MSEGLVEQIKSRLTIEEAFNLLGLDWPNRGWKVECFMHDDDHPSLHIYADQNRWQCFVCNEGGDVIDLAAKVWGIPLVQAIHNLAIQLGLDPGAEYVAPQPKGPSPTDMVLRVAAKAHGDVLRRLQADYPESRHHEAWVPLVEAAFWHYDEILRRFRNKDMSAETTYELLLVWWKWMSGGQPGQADMMLLWREIGDARFWTAVEEVAKQREQQPTEAAGDRGRAARPAPVQGRRPTRPSPARRRPTGHRGS